MLPLIIFLLAVSSSTADGKKVTMEYIGATGIPVSFSDVPIDGRIDFYFILGFAVDSDAVGNPENGVFRPYWYSALSPAAVEAAKKAKPNVKVLASLSGWNVGDVKVAWRDPDDAGVWISNAVKSLSSIAREYHLDGVDVDYENFNGESSTFVYCIGEVITSLKKTAAISVATIAPFSYTVDHYLNLYKSYGGVIDFVNYQFYTDSTTTPAAYLSDFIHRAKQFGEEKLLASYGTDGKGIQGDDFFAALTLIKKTAGLQLNGIMIYSADQSIAQGFKMEKETQAFLVGDEDDDAEQSTL